MIEEYLPIGSIIKLKNIPSPYLIITIYEDDKDKDYFAVPHPIGYTNIQYAKVIKKEDIEKVYFIGYIDNKYNELIGEY